MTAKTLEDCVQIINREVTNAKRFRDWFAWLKFAVSFLEYVLPAVSAAVSASMPTTDIHKDRAAWMIFIISVASFNVKGVKQFGGLQERYDRW